MHHFEYRAGALWAEDVAVEYLAEAIGTPFYCYSEATLRRHIKVFGKAFAGMSPLIAYSVKANSNLSVLQVLAEEGAGADVVSGGELKRAIAAGISPSKVVFSGVGKTESEIAAALDAGIFQFNIESEPELHSLARIAEQKRVRAPIAFRINPDISAGGHEKISTGKAEDKFGVPWTRARALYAKAAGLSSIQIAGVDVHIGSQIAALDPFERAFQRIAELVRELRADGREISTLDLGGGLGVPYGAPSENGVDPPHPDDYAKLIRRIAGPLNVRLIFEPGRMIVANAGILVARVIYVKHEGSRQFAIVDAGMNDLIRPALYDAYHAIDPVRPRTGQCETYDIVGPVCETSDRFARAREMPPLAAGDLVVFRTAGAYGAVQASQYNTRPLAPEILVKGDEWKVIRRRPTFEEMVDGERGGKWMGPGETR